MRRARRLLEAVLPLALLGTLSLFGAVADRALVGQARAAREVAQQRGGETARLTALSVRATLAQVEQAVVAGRAPEGVPTERLAIPPARLPPRGGSAPYSERPRADLVLLLDSTATTDGGLPEAVVARIALGEGPLTTDDGKRPSTSPTACSPARFPSSRRTFPTWPAGSASGRTLAWPGFSSDTAPRPMRRPCRPSRPSGARSRVGAASRAGLARAGTACATRSGLVRSWPVPASWTEPRSPTEGASPPAT